MAFESVETVDTTVSIQKLCLNFNRHFRLIRFKMNFLFKSILWKIKIWFRSVLGFPCYMPCCAAAYCFIHFKKCELFSHTTSSDLKIIFDSRFSGFDVIANKIKIFLNPIDINIDTLASDKNYWSTVHLLVD